MAMENTTTPADEEAEMMMNTLKVRILVDLMDAELLLFFFQMYPKYHEG